MKVYLGPYTPWWRSYFYVDYMNKKYNYDWDGPTNSFEKILEKCSEFLDWFYSVTINRYFASKKRKIKIRIDEYDTWGMDQTLSLIIVPMLKQLKATKHGSPYIDKEDIPAELRLSKREEKVFNEGYWNEKLKASKEEIEATSEKFHLQWVWVIDEMIFAHEHIADDEWTMEIWKRHNEEWNDESFAERDAIQKRINNGLRLFGKYYQSLWD